MIELAILGLLREQDLHGYELKKQLGELLGPWSSVSFGSLYPALARLEKGGRVKAVEANVLDQPSGPMTGALSGELAAFRNKLSAKTPKSAKSVKSPANRRGKKVYGITASGRARCSELLTEGGPDDERSFTLRVAFCNQLEPAERIALFERRKAELIGQLAARRRTTKPNERTTGDRRADPYRRSLRERDNRTLTHDVAWLDELIIATKSAIAGEGSQPRPIDEPWLHAPTLRTPVPRSSSHPDASPVSDTAKVGNPS